MNYKKTQKGSLIQSGIKFMNKRNIYQKDLNSKKEPNKNSETEELNK